MSEDIVEIGAQRVPGLYLVPGTGPLPDWLAPVEPASGLKTVGDTSYGLSAADAPTIRPALLEMIQSARSKVLFASWIFADERITSALCDAADRLRGGVYVLTALERDLAPKLGDLDEEPDGADERAAARREQHVEHLRRLAAAGAWLRSVPDAHAKFCVVDDASAVVTSANATVEAYERNPENLVVVRAPAVARELGRLFAHAWLQRSTIESAPGPVLDQRSLGRRRTGEWKSFSPALGTGLVATLASEESSLRRATIDLIDSAKRELVIGTYSVVAMEGHPVGMAIRSALRRGVKLLLVRPGHADDEQRTTMTWLLGDAPSNSWCIRGRRYMHAKAIVADRSRALVWTGNLDGRHGYDSGFEVGVCIDNDELSAAIRDSVVRIAANADSFGILEPTLSDAARSWPKPPLTGDWTLKLPASPLVALVERLLRTELVGLVQGRDSLLLRVGEVFYGADIDDSTRTIAIRGVESDTAHLRRRPIIRMLGDCRLRIERQSQTPPAKSTDPSPGAGRRGSRRSR